jgi:hypothetical protein
MVSLSAGFTERSECSVNDVVGDARAGTPGATTGDPSQPNEVVLGETVLDERAGRERRAPVWKDDERVAVEERSWARGHICSRTMCVLVAVGVAFAATATSCSSAPRRAAGGPSNSGPFVVATTVVSLPYTKMELWYPADPASGPGSMPALVCCRTRPSSSPS